jgi:hypothetical protein
MPYVFLAALVLLVVIVIVNWAANADAATIKRFGRYMGAFLMVAAAAFVAARGQFGIAGPILVAAYFVATGRGIPGLNRSKPAPGQSSQVETDYLQVTLDHDSGEMDGLVKQGQFQGQTLSAMDRRELSALYEELQAEDLEGARLQNAYLARRFAGEWEDEQPQAEAGASSSGPMSREEALEVLGLAADATEKQIKDAHRRLMKKFHPDQGGSTYFAARINQAKDLLLG